jgi:hypothetical protein
VGAVQSALDVGGCGRDAVAAGEEQLGRRAARRLYSSRRFTFGEFKSLADSFAAGAPLPTLV